MAIETKLSVGAAARAGAVCFALATAVLAAHSVFQSAFSGLSFIEGNTLLEKAGGQLILACAAGLALSSALYLLRPRQAMLWACCVTAMGALIVGATIYQTTGGHDSIVGGNPALLMLLAGQGSPATGIHEAELAGALAIAAGLILLSLSPRPRSRLS